MSNRIQIMLPEKFDAIREVGIIRSISGVLAAHLVAGQMITISYDSRRLTSNKILSFTKGQEVQEDKNLIK